MKIQRHWVQIALCVVLGMGVLAGCSKEAKKQRHLTTANSLFQAGDYDKAEIEYLNVLKLEGTNLVVWQNLGQIYYDQGRAIEAIRALNRAKELSPANPGVRLKLGLALAAAGGLKEAREEAVYVVGQSPTNDEALMLLADSSILTNDVRDAQQRLEKLRSAAGAQPGYHLAWGNLQARERDMSAVEASLRKALALGTNFAAAHLAMGNLYVFKKQFKEAEDEFKIAADLSPLRSGRRLRLAEFKASTGDVAGARQLLEDMEKRVPDYLPAIVRLAEMDLAERKFDACEARIKRVLGRDALNLDALALSPQLRMAQGEGAKAVADLEKLLKLNPRNPRTHYQLALAALMNNEQARALSSLAEAITLAPDYPEAILMQAELNLRRGDATAAVASLAKFTQKHPNILQGHLLLASAERARGNLDQALAVYRALARAYPTNPQPLLLAGMIQREQRKNADARASFEQALKVAPEFSAATAQLVALDLAEGKLAAALNRAQAEVTKNPQQPQPLLLLAQVYAAQTNFAQVEATLLKAIEIAPDFTPAQAQLARFYVSTKRQAEALNRLQAVVAKSTNDVLSWMQIGILQTAATNYPAARDAYEKLLAVNPRFAPALNNMAWLYSEHFNDLNRAYEFARKANDLQPNDAASADTLGWILFKRGEYVRALSLLQDSARKLPNEAEVQYHLGMTHYMLGEEIPASVAFKNAVQLDADFPGRDDALRRLEVLAVKPDQVSPAQLTELEQRLKQNPQDPVLLARVAAVYQRTGAADKALSAYEQALKLNPNSVPVLVKLAQFYSGRSEKQKEALDLARKARSLAPGDAEVAHTLGTLALAAGDHKWAVDLLEESARRFPTDPQVLHDLGTARYSMGQVTAATEAMRAAQQNSPPAALANTINQFLAFTELWSNPQPTEAALARVRESLQTQSNNVPALMVLGAAETRKGNAAAAGQIYERVLSIYPSFTPALRELAILNFGPLRSRDKAREQAMRVREVDRSDLTIARILGVASYERGEFTRAAELLSEVTRKSATDAEAFYYLGLSRQKLKQVKECKDALNQALSLQPNAEFAADAKRILAELK